MTLFGDPPPTMPALSLWQPWASLMAIGLKSIETRPEWARRLRRYVGCDLAICSTASTPRREFAAAMLDETIREALLDALPDYDPEAVVSPRTYRAGAVLAVVRVAEVLEMVSTPGHASFTACVVVHDDGADLWHPSEENEADEHVGLITEIEEVAFGHYDIGRIAVVTEDRRPLREPVPCSGRQQVWQLPPDVDAAVREQVAAA